MADRKKILFIARWYPDRHDPMLGLFVQKHALAVHLFHDVAVLYVTADNSLAPGTSIKSENNYNGIREFRIYFGKHRSGISNACAYMKYYWQGLNWIIQKSGLPDLTHVHILSRTAFPALWLKMTKGIPYLITEHWSRYLPPNVANGAYKGWLRKLFTRLAVSKADGVTTVTNNLAQAMQVQGLKNTYFITPNVADVHDFRPQMPHETAAIKKLVHISCFDEPAKNIRGIINAVKKLASVRNDFILEIIGDGKDFELVKNHAVSTGILDSRIFFTGLLTGSELSRKLREADALVMFSNYENLPCTIVESLCSGVPVISTDVGGIREHVTENFGILLPTGDETALSNALTKMLDHPQIFNRRQMCEYAISHFSMEAVGQLFNDIYQNSISKS